MVENNNTSSFSPNTIFTAIFAGAAVAMNPLGSFALIPSALMSATEAGLGAYLGAWLLNSSPLQTSFGAIDEKKRNKMAAWAFAVTLIFTLGLSDRDYSPAILPMSSSGAVMVAGGLSKDDFL